MKGCINEPNTMFRKDTQSSQFFSQPLESWCTAAMLRLRARKKAKDCPELGCAAAQVRR
jgi:hypothetical protein